MYNGTLFTIEKILPRTGLESGTVRSVGQHLIHLVTWLFLIPQILGVRSMVILGVRSMVILGVRSMVILGVRSMVCQKKIFVAVIVTVKI